MNGQDPRDQTKGHAGDYHDADPDDDKSGPDSPEYRRQQTDQHHDFDTDSTETDPHQDRDRGQIESANKNPGTDGKRNLTIQDEGHTDYAVQTEIDGGKQEPALQRGLYGS